MQALFTLTVSESKRLIAKAIAAMPEVKRARDEGYLVVGRGSTNAYVVEELTGEPIEKERYVAGQVVRGVTCALAEDLRAKPVTFHEGRVLSEDPASLVGRLGPHDVLLKGANALDHTGKVGVMMASPVGGTMGQFYMACKAQGVRIIYPVGLEKLVPSVEHAALYAGRLALGGSIGARVGMACVADGDVVTETEALDILFGLDAVHFASGGYGGAEGCVTLVVEGDDGSVASCLEAIRGLKGEPPLRSVKGSCRTCALMCSFKGRDESELPGYLV
jgi:hypothetical protein